MTVALTRLPQLSRAEFQAYWFEQHGPLVKRLSDVLGIESYVQLHSVPDDGSDPPAARTPYDGLAEICYLSREDFDARMASPAGQVAGRLVRDDERHFIDRRNSLRWWGLVRPIL